MLRGLVARLLPAGTYQWLRKQYHVHRAKRRARLPKVSAPTLRRILTEELGLARGAVAFVHASTNNLNLDFPASRVLGLLQDLVGPEGTLLFPCAHILGRAEEYLRRGGVFDVARSITTMGLLPELARRQPGSVRSLHPTNSVVAIGRLADELTRTHPDSIHPCGRKSPYYKIVDHDGWIVGLGVSTENLSFVHCVEDNLGNQFPVPTRTGEVFPARVIDGEGKERLVPTLVQSTVTRRLTWRPIPRFIRKYVPPHICRDMTIQGADFFVAQAKPLYARLEELARQGITIYGRFREGSQTAGDSRLRHGWRRMTAWSAGLWERSPRQWDRPPAIRDP